MLAVNEPLGQLPQVGGTTVVIETESWAGWVIVTVALAVQPIESVAVTVYVPTHKFVTVSVAWFVYGPPFHR